MMHVPVTDTDVVSVEEVGHQEAKYIEATKVRPPSLHPMDILFWDEFMIRRAMYKKGSSSRLK